VSASETRNGKKWCGTPAGICRINCKYRNNLYRLTTGIESERPQTRGNGCCSAAEQSTVCITRRCFTCLYTGGPRKTAEQKNNWQFAVSVFWKFRTLKQQIVYCFLFSSLPTTIRGSKLKFFSFDPRAGNGQYTGQSSIAISKGMCAVKLCFIKSSSSGISS